MKKIAVCGKGGTGKSFLVFCLAKVFLEEGKKVLVIDTDESNYGLYRLFGFNEPPLELIDFLGGKVAFKEKMKKKIIKGEKESKISLLEQENYFLENIPKEFFKKRENLYLLTIGKIKKPLEGCACPMGVLSREFLEKLILKENEVVVVDTEAGIEHFGRGIEKAIDTVIAVAEPYLEALEVAEKIVFLASSMGKKVYLVINKVPLEYEERIKKILAEKKLEPIGIIHFYPEVYCASLEGNLLLESKVFEEVKEIIKSLL